MLIEVESGAEFIQKHSAGGPPIQLDSGEWLFSDGARTDALGEIRQEPSVNERERLSDQLAYVDARLEAAVRQFDAAKQDMVSQAELALRVDNPLPIAGPEEISYLESMREQCEQLLKKHHAIMRAIHRTPEEVAERERQRREESRKASVRLVLDRLLKIRAPLSLMESPEQRDPLLEAERLVRSMVFNRPTAGAVTE